LSKTKNGETRLSQAAKCWLAKDGAPPERRGTGGSFFPDFAVVLVRPR
jgi:hypothetical protein